MKPIDILLAMGLVVGAALAQSSQAKESRNDVIAVVLGKKITVKDKDRLSGLILGALLDQFAKDNKIAPTETELDDFVRKTEEKERQHLIKLERDRTTLAAELKAATLSARARKDKESQLRTIDSILKMIGETKAQAKGMEAQRRQMKRRTAQQFVRQWKINKALYAKYGGRLIFQQAGIEPLDAYRDFLREQEETGAFRILDTAYEAPFWRYFTNDAMHTFYDKDDGANFINTPWWMMDDAPKK